ncbi:MAG TPA: NAD(P)-binding domain-containing protein [Tepidisphaeraceae bacterium]|jgi:thioredoxin reductase (NADPH)|nr:NAD(P)-binding domain-containing protein [Tepidisphaeraceae bacterium]
MQNLAAELAIIGAGPIGIELAVAFKRAGIDYLHFDARQIGYTISWFAPQTRFFSSNERLAIAGVPLFTPDQTKCTREQYLAYLRSVVVQFDLNIKTYEPVVNIAHKSGEFLLTTRRGGGECKYRVKKLVLATGGTDHPRRLDVRGHDLPHVSHYFQDPHEYFQKDLLIVGGRNSAVEAALRSHYAGARVSMSYRKPQFDAASIKYWLWPEMNGLIQSGKLKAHFNTTLKEIRPGGAVLLGDGGKTIEVPADFVLLLIGYEADMTLCKMAGVELKQPGNAPTFDPATMQTNVPGVYVAGTAMGGTQERYAVFIENCHVHTQRIMASLTGAAPPPAPAPVERPES